MNSTFENTLSQIYWKRFQQFGSTPQGSFWTTEARQALRFEIILCEIDKLSGAEGFSLADIGCGYGALVDHLLKRPASFVTSYIGYDISDQLIAACKEYRQWSVRANYSVFFDETHIPFQRWLSYASEKIADTLTDPVYPRKCALYRIPAINERGTAYHFTFSYLLLFF